MRTLRVSNEVREATERHLRTCGGGVRECLVLWTERAVQPDGVVRRVLHPYHAATMVSTQLDGEALHDLNLALLEAGERIVAQIHTHPGQAFHSSTDDAFPIVHSRGFLSIVVPRFCREGLLGLPDCFVAEFDGRGNWTAYSSGQRSKLIAWSSR